MPALYVIHQGAKLRLHNRRLQAEHETQVLMDVPLNQVSEVILFGNIGITTPLIGALLSQGVEVVFLKEDGQYRGRLSGGMTPHVPLRRTQYSHLGYLGLKLWA